MRRNGYYSRRYTIPSGSMQEHLQLLPGHAIHDYIGRGRFSNASQAKYQNVHNESMTIITDLVRAKRIHKYLECDQIKKGKKKEWRSMWHSS